MRIDTAKPEMRRRGGEQLSAYGAPTDGPIGAPRAAGLLLGLAAASVGVKVPLLPSGIPGMTWICIVLAAVVVALSPAARPLARTHFGVLDAAFLAYLVVRFQVEVFNAAELGHDVALPRLVDSAMVYVALLTARNVIGGTRQLLAFLRWFVIPAMFVSTLALVQVLRFPGVAELLISVTDSASFERRTSLGWDIRATSTIGHHTQLGGYLVGVIAIICTDLVITRRMGHSIGRRLAVLGIALMGQVATLTFATIAASAVIVLVTLLMVGVRPSMLVVGAAVGGVAWVAFGAEIEERLENQQDVTASEYSWLPETIAYRVTIWTHETIPAILERPWTGWGQDVYSAVGKGWRLLPHQLIWSSPESEYFRVLVSGGVIALAFEVTLFAMTIYALARANRAPGGSGVATPALVAFVVLLVISSIHSHFSSYGPPLVIWTLVGALMAFSSKQPIDKSAPPGVPLRQAASRIPRRFASGAHE